jgi:hypothetical protein
VNVAANIMAATASAESAEAAACAVLPVAADDAPPGIDGRPADPSAAAEMAFVALLQELLGQVQARSEDSAAETVAEAAATRSDDAPARATPTLPEPIDETTDLPAPADDRTFDVGARADETLYRDWAAAPKGVMVDHLGLQAGVAGEDAQFPAAGAPDDVAQDQAPRPGRENHLASLSRPEGRGVSQPHVTEWTPRSSPPALDAPEEVLRATPAQPPPAARLEAGRTAPAPPEANPPAAAPAARETPNPAPAPGPATPEPPAHAAVGRPAPAPLYGLGAARTTEGPEPVSITPAPTPRPATSPADSAPPQPRTDGPMAAPTSPTAPPAALPSRPEPAGQPAAEQPLGRPVKPTPTSDGPTPTSAARTAPSPDAPDARSRSIPAEATPGAALQTDHAAPSAEVRVAPPASRGGDESGAAVVGRLVRAVRLTVRSDGGSARVQLEPPHLGRVSVDVLVRDGVVSATLRTQTREAQDLVNQHLPALRQALTRNGLTVDVLESIRSDAASSDSSSRDTGAGAAFAERHDAHQPPGGETPRRAPLPPLTEDPPYSDRPLIDSPTPGDTAATPLTALDLLA